MRRRGTAKAGFQFRLFAGAIRPDLHCLGAEAGQAEFWLNYDWQRNLRTDLWPEFRRDLNCCHRTRNGPVAKRGANLSLPAHSRLGRGNLRGDPCEQGKNGKENPVHDPAHIGSRLRPVQYRRRAG